MLRFLLRVLPDGKRGRAPEFSLSTIACGDADAMATIYIVCEWNYTSTKPATLPM